MWTETAKVDWKTPKEPCEWWQLLDWSKMENTFNRMTNKELKQKILDEGYWSLGKGKFEEENQT